MRSYIEIRRVEERDVYQKETVETLYIKNLMLEKFTKFETKRKQPSKNSLQWRCLFEALYSNN